VNTRVDNEAVLFSADDGEEDAEEYQIIRRSPIGLDGTQGNVDPAQETPGAERHG